LGNLADVDEKRTIKQRKKNLKKEKKKRNRRKCRKDITKVVD
jgi:hypothetical protein